MATQILTQTATQTATQNKFSQDCVITLAQQYYGEAPATMRRLESSTNYVYSLQFRKQPNKVIKIFKRDSDKVQRELHLYTVLSKTDVPIPKIDYFDTSKSTIPYSWIMMNELGQSLHKLYWHPLYRHLGKAVLKHLFMKAGATFAHIHNVRLEQQDALTPTGLVTKSFRQHLEDQFVSCIDQLIQKNRLEQTELLKVEQLFSTFQDSHDNSLCHFDFHPKQLLINGFNISGVIDWEASRSSYSVYDFAKCELKLKMHYSMFDVFRRGYSQVRSLPSDYDEIKKPYQLVTVLAMLKSLPETSEQYGQYRKILGELLCHT